MCERDQHFLHAIDRFMRTCIGNSYNFSVKDFLFKKVTRKVSDNLASCEERDFFCSELVAKAFKECGLLNTEQSCCQFMPRDFSSNHLKLAGDARMEEELLVVFDRDEIEEEKRE